MTPTLKEIELELAESGSIGRASAMRVLDPEVLPLNVLLCLADGVRRAHKGLKVRLCSIVNARSGVCGEDCTFCAQSARYATGVERYPLKDADFLAGAAKRAFERGAGEFSIVTSGEGVGHENELRVLEEALGRIAAAEGAGQRCASLGRIGKSDLIRLRDAGLNCFHHNLETSRAFFPNVCTTHDRQERVAMLRTARELGLRICSGGIFGLGENDRDRVDFAFELAELEVDSIPLNFLHPIPGTPLATAAHLTPETCLRIIALFRLVNPKRDIVICGGRQHNLRDLQSLVFWAGANGLLIGNYLTTSGRNTEDDLKMIEDLGLEPYDKE